jgi:predicted Co/Zn/Cd cation transporter (cation efflux family)
MKPFWTSRTLWINAIAFVAAVSGAFGIDLGLDAETQTAIVGGVMALVNIVMRFLTSEAIIKEKPDA